MKAGSCVPEICDLPDIDNMDNSQLMEAVNKYSIYARVTPENKYRIVDALKNIYLLGGEIYIISALIYKCCLNL